jgi:hypothetical protein
MRGRQEFLTNFLIKSTDDNKATEEVDPILATATRYG